MDTPFDLEIRQLKFYFDHKDAFMQLVKSLEGKRCTLTLKEKGRKRSNRQNRTYWLYLNICEASEWAKDMGWEADDFHMYFKSKFLGVIEYEVDGETFTKPNSTTKLNTKEFSNEYLEKIQRWAAGKNIVLPDPE